MRKNRIEPVYIEQIQSPAGMLVAGSTDEGICLLEFAGEERFSQLLSSLTRQLNAAFVTRTTSLHRVLRQELEEYFEGSRKSFEVPVDIHGTPFQLAVWHRLMTIPAGETLSYSRLAEDLGKPDAVRAVAGANGDNPVAILIPCHRVIGANGKLTGYSGGLERKRWLLEHEQKYFSMRPDLFSIRN